MENKTDIEQYKCYIDKVDEEIFWALEVGGDEHDFIKFYKDDIPDRDRSKVQVGTFFYWIIRTDNSTILQFI